MKKRAIVLIFILVFILGCQSNSMKDGERKHIEKDTNKQENKQNVLPNNNNGAKDYQDIKLSIYDAYDIFKDKYPNAKINEIELYLKNNTYIYEIEGYEGNSKYELKIEAFSKDIIKEEKEAKTDQIGEIKKDKLETPEADLKKVIEETSPAYILKEYELKAKKDYLELEIELINVNEERLEYKYNYHLNR